jgi:hypothetical protein
MSMITAELTHRHYVYGSSPQLLEAIIEVNGATLRSGAVEAAENLLVEVKTVMRIERAEALADDMWVISVQYEAIDSAAQS